jgi:farnesyl-diphosphate farnesyltransferase
MSDPGHDVREKQSMTFAADDFVPDQAQQNYLSDQLNKVSRSFALVVPLVEAPARYYLAAAYLLCRVVDNIEDCTLPDAWKQARFGEVQDLLQAPSRAATVLAEWEAEPWPGLTEAEQRLMGLKDGLPLWQIYGAIPAAAQEVIRRWVGVMAQGMSRLSDPAGRPHFVRYGGVDVLEEAADYNEYCYYVAGTVGHMASELVVLQYGLPDDVARALDIRAEACGRSLQKTNILKDFAEDIWRGVCYLPGEWLRQVDYAPLRLQGAPPSWQAIVFDDVLEELRDATEYLVALPYDAAGYRRASLLCLLPAYQTLSLAAERCDTLFTAEHRVKISRVAMARCIHDSQALLLDNAGILEYSQHVEGRIRAKLSQADTLPQR